MQFKKVVDVPLSPVIPGIGIRWGLAKAEHTPNFAMRVIEIEPGVVFAPHQHPYEHEIYVLEGEGIASGPEGDTVMKPGQFVYVPPDEVHGYSNPGTTTLKFICVIPNGFEA